MGDNSDTTWRHGDWETIQIQLGDTEIGRQFRYNLETWRLGDNSDTTWRHGDWETIQIQLGDTEIGRQFRYNLETRRLGENADTIENHKSAASMLVVTLRVFDVTVT